MYLIRIYLPVLVGLPSAITITTHISAVLSGRTVQTTLMECSDLFSLGVTSSAMVLVTDGATGIIYMHKLHYTMFICLYIRMYVCVYVCM